MTAFSFAASLSVPSMPALVGAIAQDVVTAIALTASLVMAYTVMGQPVASLIESRAFTQVALWGFFAAQLAIMARNAMQDDDAPDDPLSQTPLYLMVRGVVVGMLLAPLVGNRHGEAISYYAQTLSNFLS